MGRGFRLIAGACWALAFAFSTAPAQAQDTLQKCVDAAGKVTYQDSPCADSQTTAGRVLRDFSIADPGALQRAREDQERADRFANARARITIAEEERKDRQVAAAAQASAAAEPGYIYMDTPQPAVVVVRESSNKRKVNRRSGMTANANFRSPGTMAIPGIMQSPAPCNTAQCRKG